jgi:hypothetical protein
VLLVIKDANHVVLGEKDISGTLMEVTYAGTFNSQTILIKCHTAGRPSCFEITDNASIETFKRLRWNGVPHLRLGDYVEIARGRFNCRWIPMGDEEWSLGADDYCTTT